MVLSDLGGVRRAPGGLPRADRSALAETRPVNLTRRTPLRAQSCEKEREGLQCA